MRALRSGDLDFGKGDFAHVVVELLSKPDTQLAVPAYLERAIRSAVIEASSVGA